MSTESTDIDQLMATRRWCFTIPLVQDHVSQGGYIPSIAIEGMPGHYPLRGDHDKAPWVCGPSLEEAEACADDRNARLGLDRDACVQIVASTFPKPKTDNNHED